MTLLQLNELATGYLPDTLGIVATSMASREFHCEMRLREAVMAPNGYVHAGSIVSLADTTAGFGCIANLPQGARGFTTIELKSNHVATAREGVLQCSARLVHAGKTTQVWDAVVTHRESGTTVALFRCTQLIIYERSAEREVADKTTQVSVS